MYIGSEPASFARVKGAERDEARGERPEARHRHDPGSLTLRAARRLAAMLAVVALVEQPQAAHAQEAAPSPAAPPAAPLDSSAPLDPSAPLDAMPDIGV